MGLKEPRQDSLESHTAAAEGTFSAFRRNVQVARRSIRVLARPSLSLSLTLFHSHTVRFFLCLLWFSFLMVYWPLNLSVDGSFVSRPKMYGSVGVEPPDFGSGHKEQHRA